MADPLADELTAAVRALALAAKRLGKYPQSNPRREAVQAAYSAVERTVKRVAYRRAVDAEQAAAQRRTWAIQDAITKCPMPTADTRYPGWIQAVEFLAVKLQMPWPAFREERPAPLLERSDDSTQGRA